jgi:hypothetical protein
MFQRISLPLVYILLVLFPITIGFAELATYFGYVMPKLKKCFSQKWLAIFLPVIFLSLQHAALPLVFDARFMVYRGLMYCPFALFAGAILYKRPSLLPYFAIMHGIFDFGAVLTLIISLE